MSRRGPMSIKDHRAWVALHGEWTPPKPRPGDQRVEHVMGQLATALARSEAELVNDVIARVGFNEPERARVEKWARQALTIVVLTAERAASSGTTFSNNILFHELAKAFSPTYNAALERGPARIPDEMLPGTLVATRDDVKYARLVEHADSAAHRRARQTQCGRGGGCRDEAGTRRLAGIPTGDRCARTATTSLLLAASAQARRGADHEEPSRAEEVHAQRQRLCTGYL